MRTTLFLAVAALLAVPAARLEAAPTCATPIRSGDRALGIVDSAGDRDLFRIEAPDGARLVVTVKAAKRSALLPDLALLDPSGAPVDLKKVLVGLTTATVTIPSVGIHETGPWTLSVSGYGGTTGGYQLVAKVEADAKARATVVVPAGGRVHHRFVGTTDARVTYTVVERSGPGIEKAFVCCPADIHIAGTDAVRSGARLLGKGIVLAQGGGQYDIEMEGSPEGATTVDVTTVVRFPKVKARRFSLDEEPRPASVSPWTGRDGTPVVVRGTGFQPGARILFGDADEALEVLWVSATEVRGVAPECSASRDGAAVPVSVVNPDGQYGSAASPFGFIGIPSAASLTPTLSPLEGGVTVDVAGCRFREGFTVEVDGIPAPSTTFLGTTHVAFVTPAAPAGVHSVVVRDEYGRASAEFPGLWYSGGPSVESADPSTLGSGGGVPVTLAGDGLVPGVRVLVAGTEASVTARVPPTGLTFLCPAARAGSVEVEVRDALGRSFRGDLLEMTRSLHDDSAAVLPPAPFGADFRGNHVALGDTTGDGMAEILVVSDARWTNPVNGQPMPGSFLLENDGAGTFTDGTASHLPAFSLPWDDGQGDAALLGDLDGNGAADAVLVRAVPLPSLDPFLSYGGAKGYYEVPQTTSFDPLTVSATRILLNGGTGLLTDRTDVSAPAVESTPALGKGERWQGCAAALGDLDGDGDGDLLVVSASPVDRGGVSNVRWTYRYVYYGYPYYYTRKIADTAILEQEIGTGPALRFLANDGSGSFTHDPALDPAPLLSGSGALLDDFHGSAVAVGDLDGDGLADAVVVSAARAKADDGSGGAKDASALRVLLRGGDGSFRHAPSAVPEPPAVAKPACGEWWQGTSVALGDLDGDGDLDIAVGRDVARTWLDGTAVRVLPALRILRNDGSGRFTEDTAAFLEPELTTLPTARTILGVSSLAAADVDGDGRTDLVLAGRQTLPSDADIPDDARPCTRILLAREEGGLDDASAQWLPAGDPLPADGMALGDLDGDGIPDLVLVFHGDPGEGRRSLRVLFNR